MKKQAKQLIEKHMLPFDHDDNFKIAKRNAIRESDYKITDLLIEISELRKMKETIDKIEKL